jgi:hypothetical protein
MGVRVVDGLDEEFLVGVGSNLRQASDSSLPERRLRIPGHLGEDVAGPGIANLGEQVNGDAAHVAVRVSAGQLGEGINQGKIKPTIL